MVENWANGATHALKNWQPNGGQNLWWGDICNGFNALLREALFVAQPLAAVSGPLYTIVNQIKASVQQADVWQAIVPKGAPQLMGKLLAKLARVDLWEGVIPTCPNPKKYPCHRCAVCATNVIIEAIQQKGERSVPMLHKHWKTRSQLSGCRAKRTRDNAPNRPHVSDDMTPMWEMWVLKKLTGMLDKGGGLDKMEVPASMWGEVVPNKVLERGVGKEGVS